MTDQNRIRNFAIVAHIDHGKSTLADRLLEATGTVEARLMREQMLDSNPIERQRGITIKLAPVRMTYTFEGQSYILNLIDTPGHVDFSYEVSRSLAACEGIILVVDATAGIQAQTVAHMQLIKERKLTVIPVINKIDLPTAKIDEVKESLYRSFGFSYGEILEISAKEGVNIDNVLQTIIARIPPPEGDNDKPLRALVFSSNYHVHKGVVALVRVVDGSISLTNKANLPVLSFHASKKVFTPIELGVFTPGMKGKDELSAGEVGYIATGLKDLTFARVGDTIGYAQTAVVPLPGYKEPKPMVFVSFFPTDQDDFLLLRQSLEKLHLTDGSFTYTVQSSAALGKGYLCGFLGLLHADVVRQRLDNEFNLNVIATSPTVAYRIKRATGEETVVRTPEDFPDPSSIRQILEPVMYTTIFTSAATVGAVMQLCQQMRGEMINLEYIGGQATFTYMIPLSELIIDFFDKLKSVSSGYASLDYEFYEYRQVHAVKIDILLNREKVGAFSQIVVSEKARVVAERIVSKLKNLIPRHQFQIPIQAAIGGKIIARADVKSFRKDVTQKLYGGDRTRKDKLLDAQKKGKKKMRSFGRIEIPQEVFFDVYKNR